MTRTTWTPGQPDTLPKLNPYRCAALVTYSKGQRWKQCANYRGFGPGERYCRFHAERTER